MDSILKTSHPWYFQNHGSFVLRNHPPAAARQQYRHCKCCGWIHGEWASWPL